VDEVRNPNAPARLSKSNDTAAVATIVGTTIPPPICQFGGREDDDDDEEEDVVVDVWPFFCAALCLTPSAIFFFGCVYVYVEKLLSYFLSK
jgi:hypothetical protein